MMNDANNNAAAVCSAQTVNAPLCEAGQFSSQSGMGQDTEAADGASDNTAGA